MHMGMCACILKQYPSRLPGTKELIHVTHAKITQLYKIVGFNEVSLQSKKDMSFSK